MGAESFTLCPPKILAQPALHKYSLDSHTLPTYVHIEWEGHSMESDYLTRSPLGRHRSPSPVPPLFL